MDEKELLKEYTDWFVDNFNIPSSIWGRYIQKIGAGVQYSKDQLIQKFLDDRCKRQDTTTSKGRLATEQ